MTTNNAVNVNLSGQLGTGNFVGGTTGTFTPVFTSSGGGTATYTLQTGTYTQIGNRILFTIQMILSALPSAGNVTIAGLPIAPVTTGAASIEPQILDASATTMITCRINASSTVLTLNTFAAGTATQLTVANCTSTSEFFISGQYAIS